jgi:hypothetical protein
VGVLVKKWQFDSFITQPESLLEEVKTEGEWQFLRPDPFF